MRLSRLAAVGLVLLAGCPAPPPPLDDTAPADFDGDGVPTAEDCDDGDATVYPGAPDTPYDGVDQDCAGDDDFDQDEDGVAAAPAGGDCDDADPFVHPGADEHCDGVDEDCDGTADDAPIDGVTVYADADLDGWGAGRALGRACAAAEGEATTDGDCDDTLAEVHPGAEEVCDGLDGDCDGAVDEEPVDGVDGWPDRDADGWGDVEGGVRVCTLPEGYTDTTGDCDDLDPRTSPAVPERCDGEDDDCDGEIDEDPVDLGAWYPDGDGDGYGEDAGLVEACEAPEGAVAEGGDCDDRDPSVNPGAVERCDGRDEDCDGSPDDEPEDGVRSHPDADGDGFGDADAGILACDAVDGWIEDGSDCDDTSPDVSPVSVETCNGRDDNCDGRVDPDDAADAPTWWIDADADRHGDRATSTTACARPEGWAATDDDCDDTDPAVNPGQRESCATPYDDDCDGAVNEPPTWDSCPE